MHARSVTAVGGTTHIPEVAAEFSGGGFSDIVRCTFCSGRVTMTLIRKRFEFPRPEWQEAAVGKFLKSLPNGTYAGLFNPKGRVREHYCLSVVKENSWHPWFALALCRRSQTSRPKRITFGSSSKGARWPLVARRRHRPLSPDLSPC
jgi:hypothetical protein